MTKSSARPRGSLGLLFLLWTGFAFPELMLHIATAKSEATLLNAGLLLAPLFSALPAVIVWLICAISPSRRFNRILTTVLMLLVWLFFASQMVYYKIFGTFYTFYSMTNGTGALQFGHTIAQAVRENLPMLALMALPWLILTALGGRLCSFAPPKGIKLRLILTALGAAAQILTVLLLPLLGGSGDTSPYGLYHSGADTYLSVNRLGLLTSFRLDIQRQLGGTGGGGSIVLDPAPSVPETSIPPKTTVPPQTTVPVETTEPEPTIDTSPNVLDLDFDALIAQESKDAVVEVHSYFASRTPSNKNEYTGMFEGCNLILLTAEAYSHLAVSEELTPTLYKLTHEGFYFSNYYVPDWGVSTTDGEYAFLTGTIPKNGVWSFSRSSDNAMPLTMNRQLMERGYHSYAYHGHTYTYYDRNEYLENLGYDYKGYGGGLDVKWQWPESDVEVVELSTGDFVDQEPFSVYYMTISGHREFNFFGNCMAMKNKDAVAHLPYSEHVRAYLACQLELENSLTLLLQRLEEAGVLENTVICLTADHYPNGLTPEEIGELLGHTPEGNFEIFRSGCILYKPGMEPQTIDAPVSHLDLLPTLSNLFGLDFDSRLYMGRDVFSETEPLICFRNRSWITDRAMYNAETGEVTPLTAQPVSDDYVQRISQEVSNRFAVSARILEYDYWCRLFP